MFTTLSHIARLIGIVKTLARHDALWPLDPLAVRLKPVRVLRGVLRALWGKPNQGRPGERLADALTALGPTYVKLGQALSVRADLVGEEVAADLSRLQDQLAAWVFMNPLRLLSVDLGLVPGTPLPTTLIEGAGPLETFRGGKTAPQGQQEL